MAPRLRRWGLIVVAGSLLVTWLLLPSGRSYLYVYYSISGGEAADESPLEIRTAAVQDALWHTRTEIERRRQSAALEQVVRAANARQADPVVFARDTSSRKAERGIGEQVAGLWHQLPTRDPRMLTVVALGGRWNWRNVPLVADQNDTLCVADVYAIQGGVWSKGEVNWAVGKCGMRERFGPPGEAWARWLESTPDLRFDLTRGPYTRLASTREVARPWFGTVEGGGDAWDEWSGGSIRSRVLVACAGGDLVSCRSSFNVGANEPLWQERGTVRYYASEGRFDSHSALPGALLWDLGPDGFAQLWRTDTSIAAAYERIRGRPIDPMLHRIALAMVGPRPKDIGLSPLALVGAIVWAALLCAWAAYRLRERRIGW